MILKQRVCDWCKRPGQLTKHEYFDGKVFYACEGCNEHARLDVRQYNLEELAFRQQVKNSPSAPTL